MTIARIPATHPRAAALPSTSSTKPTTFDNSQTCAASPVRAIEDSTIYIATRCHLSMGGSCRKTNLNAGDSPAGFRMLCALEPFTSDVNFWIGISSDTAGNTINIGGTGAQTIPLAESISDFAQHTRIVQPVTVGSGDNTDLGTALVTATVTISAGLIRVWYIMVEPVQLAPGNVTVS